MRRIGVICLCCSAAVAEVSETITQDGSLGAQKPICFDALGSGTIWGSNSDITCLGVDSGIPSSLKLHSSNGHGVAGLPVLEPQ